MRTCSSCGKGIADNTKFCPFCGAPCEQDWNAEPEDSVGPGPFQDVYNGSDVSGSGQISSSKGMSIAGLVLGIAAIVVAFIPGISWLAWICGVVGIVLSAVAISQAKKAGEKSGMAVAGLVLSIISIALGFIIFMVACVAGCAIASTATLW